MNGKKLFILRKHIPSLNKVIGDVVDILPASNTGGRNVDVEGGLFTIVTVTDLSEELEVSLRDGSKRLLNPDKDDPMYAALLPKGDGKAGCVTVDEQTLLNYVEVVNA